MDEKLKALEASIKNYQSQSHPVAGPAAAFDWTALLMIIPVLLQVFIKDPALRDVISKVIELLKGLFSK